MLMVLAVPLLAVELPNKFFFNIFYLPKRCLVTQIGSNISVVRMQIAYMHDSNKIGIAYNVHWCDMCMYGKNLMLIFRHLLN